ncbi:MBL fold metallo-hydrolase [Kitasatospora sp. McL0602]|uniref:MBL fold metallo-hydrolase n=1 Tax=Kitasatospora sp. McL0602 TaxID=3439530 RepID=UPI003F8A3D30
MDLIQVTATVWQLPLPVGHVHFVRLLDGFAVIDTSVPGSAPAVLAALAQLGGRPEDVRQIVLTHSHFDHMGSAADLVEATGARVLAGAVDAAVIRGEVPQIPPTTYTPAEYALHQQVLADLGATSLPPLRHLPVDVELYDGDTLDGWGEPVHVLYVPGHTSGDIALHLPESGVLFPGDVIATAGGRALLGPFNMDRVEALASFRRLAALEPEVLCVAHGEPVLSGAGAVLRAATPDADWL